MKLLSVSIKPTLQSAAQHYIGLDEIEPQKGYLVELPALVIAASV